jgi:hypothetical protein
MQNFSHTFFVAFGVTVEGMVKPANTETAVNDDMVDAQGQALIDVVTEQEETEATQDELPID